MRAFHCATTLPLLATVLSSQGLPEFPEPNSAAATATPFAPGVQGTGVIGAPGDADWWSFAIAAPADIRASTGPTFGLVGSTDTIVSILAIDPVTLLPIVIASNDDAIGLWSVVNVTALPAGVYYVEVKHFAAAGMGPYVLDLQALPPLVAIAEGLEPNDPRLVGGVSTPSVPFSTNGGVLAVGAAGVGFATPGSDYDFYEIFVAAGTELLLETSAGPAPTATDTVVHLADALLVPLAFDDDGGPGRYSRLVFTVPAAGFYHVVVAGWGAVSGVGSYTLQIRIGAAAVVVGPGGCLGTGGVPTLSMRAPLTELPLLGTAFYVDVTAMPALAVYFRLLGLSVPPVPISLAPFGAPGCTVDVAVDSTSLAFADAAGVDFWGFALPPNPAFAGMDLNYQAAVLDPPANPLGITTSNPLKAHVALR